MFQYVFTCSTELLSGYAQIPWWECGFSFVLIVNKCIHDTFIPQHFQPDLYRAPFEKNILVMLPILDDVAQSQNNVIYRRYDFFIAKHVEPGRGSVIFSCSCAIFRHNFSNSIPVIFFYFIKNKEVPHAQEPHHSFIHHWKLYSNDLSQPDKRKTKMCRP